MNDDWSTLLITLAILIPAMLVFVSDRKDPNVISELCDVVSFVAGTYYGRISHDNHR